MHVGVYNGENYQRVGNQRSEGFEFRGTVRPFAGGKPCCAGCARISSTTTIHYVKDADRKRLMGNVTYEHKLRQRRVRLPRCRRPGAPDAANVASEGLLDLGDARYPWRTDVMGGTAPLRPLDAEHVGRLARRPRPSPAPGTTRFSEQHQNRTIVGIAYWFPHQGNVSAAILVDYDAQSSTTSPAHPTQGVSMHGLLNF